MHPLSVSNFVSVLGLATILCWGSYDLANLHASESRPDRFALLVGCSQYVHLGDEQKLNGPTNDVRQLYSALVTRFGFRKENIRELAGTDANDERFPSKTHILQEFKTLADRVTPGSQVFVFLSGHGTRVPIPESQSDPLDPMNPEPDGFDEAFVAADARFSNGKIENLILDNEIGGCLDALRAKGAHVWAVFDCCHSGTMARGVSDEKSRELTAGQLGVPASAIQSAKDKAKRAAQTSGDKTQPSTAKDQGLTESRTDVKYPGTLVAFYAAQPFETAPDLPCPPTAEKKPENFFGLLTYTTLQTLLQQRTGTRLTYRELGQLVINRYRAERGSSGPTPTFAGDIDREVLGVEEWPGRSQIVLRSEEGKWYIAAGELQGLTTGSILKVLPQSTAGTPQKILGYVRVVSASPSMSQVQPCAFDSQPEMAVEQLQDLMRCEVVSRDLGNLRIRLSIASNSADPALTALVDTARKVASHFSERTKPYVEIIEATAMRSGDWQLLAIYPKDARDRFQWQINGPRLLLVRYGESPIANETAGESPSESPILLAKAHQSYNVQKLDAFQEVLEADLLKIFTWQNLWRLSGRIGANLSNPTSDVKVELFGGIKTETPQNLLEPRFPAGQKLDLRVKNDGTDRVWITAVFLNSDFEIHVLPTQQLNRPGSAGDAIQPIRFEVPSQRPGTQAWLVIASSAEVNREEPDFRFLSQTALGKLPRSAAAARAGASPFEMVTRSVAGQKGAMRGDLPESDQNPSLVIRSWFAAPKAQ